MSPLSPSDTASRAPADAAFTSPGDASLRSPADTALRVGPLDGLTLHEILDRFPATGPVFQRFGVHTCCGGDVTVEVAAQRDGVPVDQLARELQAALLEGR